MGKLHPGFDVGRGEFIQSIADDFSPAFVEDGCAGLNVPFPGADVGSRDDVAQATALIGQFGFVQLSFGDDGAGATVTAKTAIRIVMRYSRYRDPAGLTVLDLNLILEILEGQVRVELGKMRFYQLWRIQCIDFQQFFAALAEQAALRQAIDRFKIVGKPAEAMPCIGLPEPVGRTF